MRATPGLAAVHPGKTGDCGAQLGAIGRFTSRLEHWMSGLPLLVALYGRAYRHVIEREIALAEIESRDRVLNIGCGAAPFTALLLARHTGARITCLDRDPQAVAQAGRLVRRLGLQGSVDIQLGDAAHSAPPFDVAVVALQTIPKLGVLHRLAAGKPPGARLVVRESAEWCRDMYDRLPCSLTPRAQVWHHMGALERSALYLAGDLCRFVQEEG